MASATIEIPEPCAANVPRLEEEHNAILCVLNTVRSRRYGGSTQTELWLERVEFVWWHRLREARQEALLARVERHARCQTPSLD